MKIIILRSSFQTDDFVRNEYAELLHRLENECRAEINIIGDEYVETQNLTYRSFCRLRHELKPKE